MSTKAEAAIYITEDIGGWPRDIANYLTIHGLPCEPFIAEVDTERGTRSATIGYIFEDGSVVHEDFEISFDNEDAAQEWYCEQPDPEPVHYPGCGEYCYC